MSKSEKFIQDCTKNCSNVVAYSGMIEGSEFRYHEWLTPVQARKAVEIAKEEIIEKACEYLQKNMWRIVCEENEFRQRFVTDFKNYMKNE